jgi:hypothetical protein
LFVVGFDVGYSLQNSTFLVHYSTLKKKVDAER